MSHSSHVCEGLKSRIIARLVGGELRYFIDGKDFATLAEARSQQRVNDHRAIDPTCGGLISIGEDGREYA
jgi:hypothetical protein